MEEVSRTTEGPYYIFLDNKQPKNMVFVEGFFCMKGISSYMFGHLKTCNVYSYEMINHFDKNRWQDNMSYEEMAKDLKKFVTEQGLEKFTLSGVCVGARVAMKFAGMYPEMVETLVVIEGNVGEFYLPYVHDMIDFMTENEGKPSGEIDSLLSLAFPGG